LWENVADPDRSPNVVVLFNKQDLFHKNLKTLPLEKGCDAFHRMQPKQKDESHDDYCLRCEREVTKYFRHIPSDMKKEGEVYNKLSDYYLTCATDAEMFKSIMGKLLAVFSGIIKEAITSSGL
jgi:hypothetical protein